jgi:delta 1-pyrroline-5-carboxylate dehydrogenase
MPSASRRVLATPTNCELCGEPSGGAPRHASPAECFATLRQALNAAREELNLARGQAAVAEHHAEMFQNALRELAGLVARELPAKSVPRVIAQVREVAERLSAVRWKV